MGYSEVFWDVVDLVMFLGMLFFNVQDLGMSEIGYPQIGCFIIIVIMRTVIWIYWDGYPNVY